MVKCSYCDGKGDHATGPHSRKMCQDCSGTGEVGYDGRAAIYKLDRLMSEGEASTRTVLALESIADSLRRLVNI